MLGWVHAALAAEGGLRGPDAPDAPSMSNDVDAVGMRWASSNKSSTGQGASFEGLLTNGSSFDGRPALAMRNTFGEMDSERMPVLEMLSENSSLAEKSVSLEEASRTGALPWRQHNSHRGGKVLVLFHQTSPGAGPLILQNGFKLGTEGWCGGGIYFATSPQATYRKAIGPESHHGYIVGARVNVGRVKYMGSSCDRSMTGLKLWLLGYDSIHFNPGDGDEYVVYSKHRILSTWHHTR